MITINLIGAGKVGRVILEHFPKSQLCQFVSVCSSQERPANLSNETQWVQQRADLPAADWFMIATPDHTIAGIAQEITNLHPDASLIHFSGALCADIMNPKQSKNIRTASLHPALGFYAEKTDYDMSEILFCAEGDPELMRNLKGITGALQARFSIIDPEKKAAYHAACCLAANYMQPIADVVTLVLEDAGIEAETANFATQALMLPAVERITQARVNNWIPTGPVARGDIETIQKHVTALEGEALAVYKTLARACARRYSPNNDAKIALLALLDV